MSTQLAPTPTALPPPMRHLLYRERPIGWLEGNRLGFFGFADAREAGNAAWVAYRTMSRKVAPSLGLRPTPIDIEHLGLEQRNGRESITASGRPFAVLVRPERAPRNGSSWFGFTIDVPPAVGEREMRDVMRVAGHALVKSGIAWSMLRPRARYVGRVTQQIALAPPLRDRRRIQRRSQRAADARTPTRELDPFGHRRPRRYARR